MTQLTRRANGLHPIVVSLKRYLEQGIDPYDFAYKLDDFFREHGIRKPRGFDPDDPTAYVQTKSFDRHRKSFVAWISSNLTSDDLADVDSPSYLHMSAQGLVMPRTWLVHFSDHARDIAEEGFLYGHPEFQGLALTTHKQHRQREPGLNFAFEASDRSISYGAAKYGRSAVLFRSGGVRAYHSGDEESQVIFWGPLVRQVVLLDHCDESDWCVVDKNTDRLLYKHHDIRKVVAWVIDHGAQYRRRIVRDLPPMSSGD